MSGVLYVGQAAVEATTGRMLVTFESGGDARFAATSLPVSR